MSTRIVFTADLHGNKAQYDKLFEYAQDGASAIIIGGDIAPKDARNRTIDLQKAFLADYLIPRIAAFHQKNSMHCDVFLIMGNDDFKANYDFLKESENGYVVLDDDPTKWNGYYLVGYPYVPYTPFVYKDWEKADLTDKKETDRKDIKLDGVMSTAKGFKERHISLDDRNDSIEKDIYGIMGKVNPRKAILVIHSPPFNTKLDMMSGQKHVGSEAVMKMIKEKQPLLTLHGHIHETVRESGAFMEVIGGTVSLNPGNSHIGPSLAIIEIDPEEPQSAKRIIL